MKPDVVVVGGAGWDVAVRGDRLPGPGESLSGDRLHAAPGGKGANAAVAASRMGAAARLVARVGADRRGDAVRERLAAEGVDAEHLVRDPESPTGVTLIHVDRSGRKQTLACPGAVAELTPEDVRRAAGPILRAGCVLVQLEAPAACVGEALRIARAAARPVVLDPAPAGAVPYEWLAAASLVTPNAWEASVLTGIQVDDADSARRAARLLREKGARAAAVPAGEAGKLLVWEGGELLLPRIRVEVVDTTGAGDAFAAAAEVGVAEGRGWEEIGPLANAAAAHAATALGAQSALPRRNDVLELLGRAGAPDRPRGRCRPS